MSCRRSRARGARRETIRRLRSPNASGKRRATYSRWNTPTSSSAIACSTANRRSAASRCARPICVCRSSGKRWECCSAFAAGFCSRGMTPAEQLKLMTGELQYTDGSVSRRAPARGPEACETATAEICGRGATLVGMDGSAFERGTPAAARLVAIRRSAPARCWRHI